MTAIIFFYIFVGLFIVNRNTIALGNEILSAEEEIVQMFLEDIITSGNFTVGDSGSSVISGSVVGGSGNSTDFTYSDSIPGGSDMSGSSGSSSGLSFYSSSTFSSSSSHIPTVPELPPPVGVFIPPSVGFNTDDSSSVSVPCTDCDSSPVTPVPASTRYCREYEASSTNNATENTCRCNFDACAGEMVLINACHCEGNPLLRFKEISSNTEISLENGNLVVDYSLCSNGCPSYYFVNQFSFPCRLFSIAAGCEENEDCSARVKVSRTLPFRSMSKQRVQQTLVAMTLQNTTNTDDYYYYYYYNNDTTTDDDDGYLNSPNPYLDTVCPSDTDYNTDANALVVSGFVIGAVCLAAGGCCLIGLICYAVKYFFPDFVQDWKDSWLKMTDRTTSMLTSCVSWRFNHSVTHVIKDKPMFKLKKRGGDSVIVPVCTADAPSSSSSAVELTPWEKRQGFFRSSIDSQVRRFAQSNNNNGPLGNNHHHNKIDPETGQVYVNDTGDLDCYDTYGDIESDENDDNVSQMGELEEDDPRVLKKLARKYKEQQKQLAQAQLRTPQRNKPSPSSGSPSPSSPQYPYGHNDDNTNVIFHSSSHHPSHHQRPAQSEQSGFTSVNNNNNNNNNNGMSQKTFHQAPQVSFSMRSQQTQHTARIYPASSSTASNFNNHNNNCNNSQSHGHTDESLDSGDVSFISLSQQAPPVNSSGVSASSTANNKNNHHDVNHYNNNNHHNQQPPVASIFSYDRHLLEHSANETHVAAQVTSFAQSQPLVCYFDEELGEIPLVTHLSNASLNDSL